MSTLTYNSVDLSKFIRTREVDIDLVMDPSGVDPLYQHITLHVQCLLDNATLGQAPSQWLKANYPKLTSPRQTLSFLVNNQTFISSNSTLDVKNGPIPKACKVIEIDSDQSMMMLFTVETWLHTCANGNTPNNILSHRWRENVSIDQDFYTTWTRTGTVVFKSSVAQPDDLRGTFYPPIVKGFQRMRSDWTIDEAGTGYSYTIEDKEVYLNPPEPATYADGDYSVTSANNAQIFAECNVTLRGAKTTPKAMLISLATQIALGKLKVGGQQKKPIPVGGAVKERMYKNEVSVMIRARWQPVSGQIANGLALAAYGLGALPTGSTPSTPAPDFGPFGTSGVEVIKSQIVDWCQSPTTLKAIGTASTQQSGSVEGSSVQIRTGTVTLESSAGDYGSTDTTYQTYTITKSYRNDPSILQMPIASSSAGNACSIVQIAAPIETLDVEYKVEGIGAKPARPSTDPSNRSVVKLGESFTPFEAILEPDGTSIRYAMLGSVSYAFETTDGIVRNAGVPPWIKGVQSGSITYTETGQKGVIGREA